MKSLSTLLGLVILGIGAYFVLSRSSDDGGDAETNGARTSSAEPSAPGGASPGSTPGGSTATLADRPPEETAAPFTVAEEDRVVDSPFTPGATIDTPLVVSGETIPVDEVKRHLCLGVGYAYSEYEKFNVIIQRELADRKAAGEDVSKYEVTEADVDRYIEKQRIDFASRYPTLDFPTEVGRAYLAFELYRAPAAQSLVFDRLFLPENPREWPAVSQELIRAFGGDMFLDDAVNSYDRRKQRQLNEGLPELPPDDPIIVQTWKDTVLRGLSDFAAVEMSPDRLPQGMLMIVDGVEIPIERVYAKIAPFVSPMDVDETRRFLALCKLMEDDLQARGALLDQGEFETLWSKDGKTYRQMLDAYLGVATQLMGHPSVLAYADYTRILESLRKEKADELADVATLQPYILDCNQVTGVAKAAVEVILCSAWDGDANRWKANGWEDARRRAGEVIAELEGGADWKAVRELKSEFWDPPLPEVGNKPMHGFRFKGALGEQTRNQLFTLLEENESINFTYGNTITDRIFYGAPLNETLGPWLGTRGYYIVRVTGRTPPVRPLDMSNDVHRKLVEDYYLKRTVYDRSQELLAAGLADGTVTGL